MWPVADMPITWSLVDCPTGEGKVLMTNGGKQKWGTHDLVTRRGAMGISRRMSSL